MKLNKKRGSVHIDWVISIGIFLTFIVLILAFIKPGYNPEFEGRVLIDLVENNFKERAEWEVNRNLINLNCETGGIKNFNLKQYIPGANNFKLLDKNMNFAPSLYKDSIKLKIQSGMNQFFVVYGDATYPGGTLEGNPDNPTCNIGSGNPVVFKGLRESKLNLNDLDLNDWDFPEFRTFRVRILESNGVSRYCFAKGGLSGESCENMQIPEQVEVYAADKGTSLLDKDLNREQVILNILVF